MFFFFYSNTVQVILEVLKCPHVKRADIVPPAGSILIRRSTDSILTLFPNGFLALKINKSIEPRTRLTIQEADLTHKHTDVRREIS